MTAVVKDHVMEEGATFKYSFIWADANKVGFDLTGYTARMHLRQSIDDAATLLELTTANSRIFLNETDGLVRLQVDESDTQALSWAKSVYDLELVDTTVSPNEVYRLMRGNFTVSKEVTR